MTDGHAATAVLTGRPGRDTLDSVGSYLAEVLSAIRPLAPRRLGIEDAVARALVNAVLGPGTRAGSAGLLVSKVDRGAGFCLGPQIFNHAK